MSYTLHYGQVVPYLTYLAGGAWITLQLAAFAFVIGSIVGLLCASVLEYGPKPARALVRAYVLFVLNTPLLVQIFFLALLKFEWEIGVF
jgi:polar amino acid transport system permease protein